MPIRNVTEEATTTLCCSSVSSSNPVMYTRLELSLVTNLSTTLPIIRLKTGKGPERDRAD